MDKPSSMSPYAKKSTTKSRYDYDVDKIFQQIRKGDRTTLARGITLIESNLPNHQDIALALIEKCLPHAGNSMRVGITGVPGAGKSTFIEAMGLHVLGKGHRLAVLAIDPSSHLSKGSILGDKTRMEKLSAHPKAFIRPSPSSGTLGGIAAKTRETIILCEAAGFDVVWVETVGVGQSEVNVHQLVDFFLLLAIAGAGDELQGIKRGIMELADAIVINKSDGDNIQKTSLAKNQLEQALHLMPPTLSGWIVPVKTCSSLYNKGIEDIWQMTEEYFSFIKDTGFFSEQRIIQQSEAFNELLLEQLKHTFFKHPGIKGQITAIRHQVEKGTISVHDAVKKLMQGYWVNGPSNKE